MLSKIRLKKYPNVKQHDSSDCAAAVISTILLKYKKEISLMKVREIIGTDAYGTSVKGIVEGFEKLKFNVKAVRTSTKDLTREITLPAIAQVKTESGLNHFVVLNKITKKNEFIISDPANEVSKQTYEDFDSWFTGVFIVLIPTSEFEESTLKDKSMFEVFKVLILPQKRLLFTTILISLLLSLLGILSSLFSKVLMDEIIPFQLKKSLYVFLLFFILVSLVQNLLSAFRQHVLLYLSRKIDIPLLLGYYNHIIRLPYFFFITRKVGDILTRFQDAMTIKEIFTSLSISLVMDVLLSVISAIVLWNLNSKLFGILLLIVIINIILIYVFKKPYKKYNYEQMESSAMLNAQLIESVENIETIKSMSDESSQISKLESRYVNALKLEYKVGILQNFQGFLANFVGALGNVLFMGVGALFIIDGKMSIGDLLVFQTLSQYFTEPIQNLVSLQITFQEAQISMKRLGELMSLDVEEDESKNLLTNIPLNGDIVFGNVSFSYGSRPPVINDLNLTIPSGKKVAFVGESGAGKSTIARLIMKFIENESGKITLTGYNIKDIGHQFLRNKIAYIPQNIELFSGTIIDNLKVGNNLATYEEIVTACKLSGASDFIESMPNRYGSYIEEGGSNLSGGEKQRLAIARALLKEPEIFLFDEATSNLDSFSERKIHDLIFNKITSKTTIIIAHRLSTIMNSDYIYLLDKGKVIESGNHHELMALNGKYASMINMQMSHMDIEEVKNKYDEHNYEGEEITYG
ncbi:peptidase domain-containing ABC transporter [Erysipelothrix urinaevulpis]|uniref:peptidase domain-containing ABC transporter n=1 Tax=Erysipelothrix urinaevulpis TaxID=2683717 RepID=UPI00135BE5A7|nr:peptidase domain-containing ABC transporter [Erysipelothrix urinaevulpis]